MSRTGRMATRRLLPYPDAEDQEKALVIRLDVHHVGIGDEASANPPSGHAGRDGVARRGSRSVTVFGRRGRRFSPLHDDVPLRTYAIRDLDRDGRYEVLETVSAFESAPGFLNVEIGPAFEWVHVYRCKDGKFTEDTRSFRWFLLERKAHYEFWRRVLDAPSVLSPDSRSLVEANRADFRRIMDMYLKRIW